VVDDNTSTTRYDFSNGQPAVVYEYQEEATDSCSYSGSGDWNAVQTDNCYITASVYVVGSFNLIGNIAGTGSFGCAPGVTISAESYNFGSGRTNMDAKCIAVH
jgi:hypothetical protein